MATFRSEDILNGVITRFDPANVFFGLTDERFEESWLLIDDTEPVYTNWEKSYPLKRESHNCAALLKNGGWADYSCTTKYMSMCENVAAETYFICPGRVLQQMVDRGILRLSYI